jgi:hypothetical protein
MVRTIKLHIWKLHAPVQPSGRQPLRSGRSKPYYGNFVQPKCNRSDARATPSRRGLVMEAFSTILEKRLQLTVRTPFDILIITFYSNIGLGRNRRRWKADKKCCQLTIRTATRSVRTDPVRTKDLPVQTALQKIPELLSEQENLTRPDSPRLPSGCACFRLRFGRVFGFPKPINKMLEACFQDRIRW